MEIASQLARDVHLIVEGLVGEALELHRGHAPVADADECLAEAKALLAGERHVELMAGCGDGQA